MKQDARDKHFPVTMIAVYENNSYHLHKRAIETTRAAISLRVNREGTFSA
jgi:hypothetical protein